MNNRVSILIVTWNGDDLLRDCLSSLHLIYGTGPEVVVVDNANLNSTRLLVAEYPNAKYIAAEENLGFAGGNNLGWPLCTREYVLLLNNDTHFRGDSLAPLVTFLDAHPRCAVAQGTMNLPLCGDQLDACGALMTGIGKLHLCHMGEPTATTPLSVQPVFSAKGAFMMVRRSCVAAMGGNLFQECFFNNYEESDFCHRTWLAGYEVYFVPTLPIDHLYNATIKRLPPADVRAQEIANTIFSYRTLWGWYGRLRIMPLFYAYRYLMALRDPVFRTVIRKAAEINDQRRSCLLKVRKTQQQNRRVSDWVLLKKTRYHAPRGYWIKILKTWLKGAF